VVLEEEVKYRCHIIHFELLSSEFFQCCEWSQACALAVDPKVAGDTEMPQSFGVVANALNRRRLEREILLENGAGLEEIACHLVDEIPAARVLAIVQRHSVYQILHLWCSR
jgi:hypothetical protein